MKRPYLLSSLIIISALFCLGPKPNLLISANPLNPKQIQFIGDTVIPHSFQFKNTEVGGLSGITYNPEKNVYYAISDDRSKQSPARFYTFNININNSPQNNISVKVIGVTTLLDQNGQTFPTDTIDPEDIVWHKQSLFIVSEGDVKQKIPPFIKEFSLDGKEIRSLPIPDKFLFNHQGNQGIRNNLAFEAITITPDGKYLFVGIENALVQDGEITTVEAGTKCRLIKYNLTTGEPEAELLYVTEPLSLFTKRTAPGPLNTNGLVGLIALDAQNLLTLERAFSMITANRIRIFLAALGSATNISNQPSLADDEGTIKAIDKQLLIDLPEYKFFPDNIEGMTFGPNLSNDQRLLILVSDNNFNSLQTTQIAVFSLPNFDRPGVVRSNR